MKRVVLVSAIVAAMVAACAQLESQPSAAHWSGLLERPATFSLYFPEGKDELTPDSEREVKRVFAEIAARPYPEILVIGHIDAVGIAEFNDHLSRQRAQRVRDKLVKRGIAVDHIEV